MESAHIQLICTLRSTSGSVLGPLLFLIYIDTITSLPLSEATKVSIYTDDLLVYLFSRTAGRYKPYLALVSRKPDVLQYCKV